MRSITELLVFNIRISFKREPSDESLIVRKTRKDSFFLHHFHLFAHYHNPHGIASK